MSSGLYSKAGGGSSQLGLLPVSGCHNAVYKAMQYFDWNQMATAGLAGTPHGRQRHGGGACCLLI